MTENKLFIQNLHIHKELSSEERGREKNGKHALVCAIGCNDNSNNYINNNNQ